MPVTSDLAPTLGSAERLIRQTLAAGAIALLLAAVVALLTRVQDLNTELDPHERR